MIFEVYALKINRNIDKHEIQCLLNKLPKERIKRIMSFYKYEDTLRALGGEILVRYMISHYRGIPLNEICICIGEYGKPYLKNDSSLHFNISHSGEWVVATICEHPVGIDVQEIEEVELELNLLSYFSENERQYIMNRDDKLNCFYDLWTLKESYIKAIGMGLFKSLDSFSISINDDSIVLDDSGSGYYFKQYKLSTIYKLAVCSLSKEFPNEIKLIDWEGIYGKVIKLDHM